jgi:hypothetical protein
MSAIAAAVLGVLAAAAPQQPVKTPAGDDPRDALHNIRMELLRATEENIETLQSFQLQMHLAAVCLNDIDGIQDQLGEQLDRVENLLASVDKDGGIRDVVSLLVKTDVEVVVRNIDLKKKRARVSMRVCGIVPIVVTRAQHALTLLDEAEHVLSLLR